MSAISFSDSLALSSSPRTPQRGQRATDHAALCLKLIFLDCPGPALPPGSWPTPLMRDREPLRRRLISHINLGNRTRPSKAGSPNPESTLISTTRPSTNPALNVNAGLALAYVVSALASATGSDAVYAIDVMPRRSLQQVGGSGSFGRLLRQIILDNAVFPPAPRTALRSSKS